MRKADQEPLKNEKTSRAYQYHLYSIRKISPISPTYLAHLLLARKLEQEQQKNGEQGR